MQRPLCSPHEKNVAECAVVAIADLPNGSEERSKTGNAPDRSAGKETSQKASSGSTIYSADPKRYPLAGSLDEAAESGGLSDFPYHYSHTTGQ